MNPFLSHRIRLTDREIELLLSGSPESSDEHADLSWFLTTLADQRPAPPHDVEHMATALASAARSSAPDSLRTRPRRAARRMVALAASFAVLFAMSGIALAADDAAPGDLLYGVDQAFELIGIGDGGVEEQIAEFYILIARGEDETAFEFIEEVIESSSEAESAEAQTHLNLVAGARSEVAKDEVAEHREFIEESKKGGVGIDGRDFGQGVADIVRNRDKDLPERAQGNQTDTPATNDRGTGRPDDAGPSEDTGPPAEPPPQSSSDSNQDSKGNQNPGPPPDTGSHSDNGNSGGNSGTEIGSSEQSTGIGDGKSDQASAGTDQVTGAPDKTGRKDK